MIYICGVILEGVNSFSYNQIDNDDSVFLCRLRVFDSGVMVVQSKDHSEDKVIKSTAALVSHYLFDKF